MNKLLFSAFLLTAFCASAQNGGLTAKPVRYLFNLPDIEGLPQGLIMNSWGNEKAGCEITYLIAGENISAIEEKSVSITSITTKDGKDLSKDTRGRAAWKLGPFPKASDDGSYAVFSLFVPIEGAMTVPIVKGSITVKAAGKTETQTLTFKTANKGVEQKTGPFTFAVADDAKDGDDDTMRGFGFGGFGITMTGDMNLIADISINAGGRTIKRQGHMSINNQTTKDGKLDLSKQTTTYQFASAPRTPEFTLTVTYFTDMRDVPVAIGQ